MVTCSHGMPTPASCTLCMEDGPVLPPPLGPEQKLRAGAWIFASYDGRCARHYAHEFSRGDRIGYVQLVGWCCEECAA